MDIEHVPIFVRENDWVGALDRWLQTRGLCLVGYRAIDSEFLAPACLHIATGPSTLGGEHAIVMRGDEVIHDGNSEARQAGLHYISNRFIIAPLADDTEDIPELRMMRPPRLWLLREPVLLLMIGVDIGLALAKWGPWVMRYLF
jgi:hypothetical protein